ncbi:MAG: sel1 repeat family protein [Gammaproteobacteria bacterium]|nr:sel1 repeat family protein [Gammaproteobacteria bacterium]
MSHPLKFIVAFNCIATIGLTIAITACLSDPNADAQYREQLAVCRSVPPDRKDPQHAQKALGLSKSCEALIKRGRNDPDLYFYYGRLLELGNDETRAVEQLRIAVAKGSAKAMTLLGRLVETNMVSIEAAGHDHWSLYEQAAALGDPVAQVYLAIAIELSAKPPTDKSRQRMYTLLTSASVQGYAIADYHLGMFHYVYSMYGKPADEKLAVQYLERAARGGVRDAVEALGGMGHDISIYGKLEDMETTARADDLYRP